jgi:hypothetical protein
MNKLTFYTPTTLDEAFIFTMGASVKKNDSPIGFFGTGLKYAIAVTLRLGGTISIKTNETNYSFSTYTKNLRGQEMIFIRCSTQIANDDFLERDCPMTTDYGKTWEPWMVMRELWSNTQDEKGNVYTDGAMSEKYTSSLEYTIITVDHPAIYDAWLTRDKYILNPQRVPIVDADLVKIYYGNSDTIFYRGISVAAQPIHSRLTYNFKQFYSGANLTEDRTIDVDNTRPYICGAIFACKDKALLSTFFHAVCSEGTYENKIRFSVWNLKSEATQEVIETAIEAYKNGGDSAPESFKQLVWNYLRELDPLQVYKKHTPDAEQERRLSRCLQLLTSKGFNITKYEFHLSYDMEAMGLASSSHRHIILNPKTTLDIEKWEEQTCMTLIEEFTHLEAAAGDFTRDFQDALTKYIYDLCKHGRV